MSMGDPSRDADADLLERVAARDEAAFGQLYDRFSPGIYSMVFKMTRDEAEANDVLQDAFSHVWRKADTYDRARSAAFTWVVMIARNKCVDRLRVRQRFARIADRAAAEAASHDEADLISAEVPVMRDERNRLRAMLADMGDEERRAIEMAFFNDLTHEEVAERLGAPLGTVKARIRRGLLKLRTLLSVRP